MTYTTQISEETIKAYRAWSNALGTPKASKLYQKFASLCEKEKKTTLQVINQVK